MRVRRIAISGAIVAFWLVMMALLVRNHILPRYRRFSQSRITPAALTEQWRDYEEWMRLAIGRRSDGVSYTTVRRLADGTGYLACSRVWLDLDVFGSRHAFRLQTTALLDPAFCLNRVAANVELDDIRMRFRALATNRRLLYRWELGERVRVGTQRLGQPISLLEAVRPLVARRVELEVGNVYELPVLDSTWSLREGSAEVRVAELESIEIDGKAVDAYRLEITLNNFQSKTWVNAKGEILRREFANNILMERVDPEEARKRFPGIDAAVEMPPIDPERYREVDGQSVKVDEEVGPLNLLLELFRTPSERR